MSAEDDPGARWYLAQLFHENGTCVTEFVDYVPVVNDFLPDIYWTAVKI